MIFISSTGVLLGPHHGIADDAVSAGIADSADIADSAVIGDIAYFTSSGRFDTVIATDP